MKKILLTFIIVTVSICTGKVADSQYGKIPAIFHSDNYDHCMLRGNEALFCSFTYELAPVNPTNTTEIWHTIQELSSKQENYRHDLLRHAICIPETCPNIDLRSNLSKEINRCYDDKFGQKHLKGKVTNLKCETNKSPYPVDWLDIVVGLFFVAYLSLVTYATFSDWWKVPKENQDESSTQERIISAFSVPKNLNRLVSIKGDETNQWRAIQGVRFYNQLIVILSHSVLLALAGPVANTKYSEETSDKFLTVFLASGPLALGTNFFLATLFLTYGLYSQLEGKQFKFTSVLMIFLSRIMRLLPAFAVLILTLMTWVRHLGRGPYWNFFIMREFKYCRKNGWSNLLFLNTIINPEEMCSPHTWYLAQDTQYFFIALVLIWIFKKYHKLMFPTLIAMIVSCMGIVFFDHYLENYDSIIFVHPELAYEVKNIRVNRQWFSFQLSFYGNLISSLLGIVFGYGYYVNRKTNFLKKYDKFISKYYHILSYGPALTVTCLPGILALHLGIAHSAFWASFYNATARLVFTVSVGGAIIACTLGYGGPTKKVLEWSPTFVLGRLSYSAYLIQFVCLLIRGSLIRFPLYLSDYTLFTIFFGDVAISYLAALVLCLLFELPISELQKLMLPNRDQKEVRNAVKRNNEKESETMNLNGIKTE